MCFHKSYGESKRVSKEDIEVYKVGTLTKQGFRPGYQSHFLYKKDVKPPTVGIPDVDGYQSISFGYHAYRDIGTAAYRVHKDQPIGVFIIPAGTGYFQNHEEMVAEQIVWKGVHLHKQMTFLNKLKVRFKMLFQ